MNRFLSLLLIPLLMLGHVLPHSHDGIGMEQVDGHAARPHIHLTSHHHHGHSHEHAQVSDEHEHGYAIHQKCDAELHRLGISGLVDHDSDAVYLASASLAYVRLSGIDSPSSDLVAVVSEHSLIVDFPTTRPVSAIPLRRSSSLPLYLLTASLRL